MDFLTPLIEQLESMWVGGIKLLPLLVVAGLVMVATWLAVKVATKIVREPFARLDLRPSLEQLFITLTRAVIWVLGGFIAITVIFPSLTPANLLAGLGLGTVAIGFAFQDIFENFFAGIMIMLRKSMRIGDFIECEGIAGQIEEITIRDTSVRQTDGQLIMVPNSLLFKNPVQINTDRPIRRYDMTCGVAYDVDLEEARQVIRGALEKLDCIKQDKGIEVYASGFGSSSMDFNVRWWAEPKPSDMDQSRDKVVRAVKKALDDAGIEIPFPYRTLTFKEPLPLQKLSGGQPEEASV